MKAFPAQFNRFSKNVMGDNIISLRVDARFSQDISELVSKDIGTEFMVHLVEVDITLPPPEPVDLKKKFWKKMHSLINDYAEISNTKPEDIKTDLKQSLKALGEIKESTKELDIKGLSNACAILESWIQGYGK